MGALRRRPTGLQGALRDFSVELLIASFKMRSIIDVMVDYLGSEIQNSHLEGLAAVMQDLVAEVEELASRSDRMSWAKAGKGPTAGPSATAAAA